MKTIEDIAQFIADRDDLRALNWQIFDMSAAAAMTEEMCRQYDTAGEWRMNTPMPAQNCIFWDGRSSVFATQEEEIISCGIAEEFDLARLHGDKKGKAQALIDLVRDDPKMRPALYNKYGPSEAERLIADAKDHASAPDYAPNTDVFKMDDDPKGACGRLVAVWSEFIGFPIARQEQKQVARPIRRRLARIGVSVDVRTISLSPASHKAAQEPHSPGARKALHFCRGHWRKSPAPSGRTWIAGHWRGNPELGIVLHNYVATIADVDNRARLVV